jgi:hypothetical protein
MPNVNVFRGSDATLVLAVEDSESQEGQLADGLISQYDLSSVVARLQQVQVKVENDVYPYHEIGQRFASELRPGNINISGTARRAHINGAMIRLLLGDGLPAHPRRRWCNRLSTWFSTSRTPLSPTTASKSCSLASSLIAGALPCQKTIL